VLVVGDVGDPAGDQPIVDAVIVRLGTVDCLINTVGRTPREVLLDITPAPWDSIITMNLSVMCYLSRLVLPGMIRQGWGRIINVWGTDAQTGSGFRAHNVMAKAGAIGLVKEYAYAGIIANVVVPGMIEPIIPGGPHIQAVFARAFQSVESARVTRCLQRAAFGIRCSVLHHRTNSACERRHVDAVRHRKVTSPESRKVMLVSKRMVLQRDIAAGTTTYDAERVASSWQS